LFDHCYCHFCLGSDRRFPILSKVALAERLREELSSYRMGLGVDRWKYHRRIRGVELLILWNFEVSISDLMNFTECIKVGNRNLIRSYVDHGAGRLEGLINTIKASLEQSSRTKDFGQRDVSGAPQKGLA